MDTSQQAIIYFLGLYAPENIVGNVFGITDTPIDITYDTTEVVDSYCRSRLHYLYTEEDIKEYVGSNFKPIKLYTNCSTNNFMYTQYTHKYLVYKVDGDANIISRYNKSKAYNWNYIGMDIAKYGIEEFTSTEFITIKNLIEYHMYICTKDNGWYAKYYKMNNINPARILLKQIFDKLCHDQCKTIYILTCLMLENDDLNPNNMRLGDNITSITNTYYATFNDILEIP